MGKLGILEELAKRVAMKTATALDAPTAKTIPTAAEGVRGALVPTKGALQQAAPVLEQIKQTAKPVENAGRRKFLKQAVASATRKAVPDAIAKPLMSMAAKSVAKEVLKPEIPAESLQAAVAAAMQNALTSKALRNSRIPLSELEGLDTRTPKAFAQGINDLAEVFDHTPEDVRSIYEAYDLLQPSAIAKTFGLPEDLLVKHIADSDMYPHWALDEIIYNPNATFFDETARARVQDWGYDQLPKNIDANKLAELRAKLAALGEDSGWGSSNVPDQGWDRSDLEGQITDLIREGYITDSLDKYSKLLGTKNLDAVVNAAHENRYLEAIHPRDATIQRLDDDAVFDVLLDNTLKAAYE